jgi:hypothetical protein
VVHASNAQRQQASKAYRAALEAIDAKKFDEALALLQESYEAVASPNSLLLKARTLVLMDRPVDAYRELQAALELAEQLAKVEEKYAQTAESARKDLDEVKKKIALVSIEPPASVRVGESDVPVSDWAKPLPMPPGKAKVTVKHAGGQQTTEELELKAGESKQVSTAAPEAPPPAPAPVKAAPPAPPAPSPDGVQRRTLAYVSGAIGLAGAGTFAAFTVLGKSEDGREGCAASVCPESTVVSAEKSSSYQTLAFVGLGVGVIGLCTSAYLFATSSSEAPEERPVTDVAIGPGQVMLFGKF